MNAPAHPAFQFLRSQRIESLDLDVSEYRHLKTGAQHIHIATDNPENVFLVALRTVPEDSRGVAHILEHTALCGSEKYPVRDPFFMMIRRSLNTFMNAFTSSDWTAYPFASQNRKDFNNLLQVYLDAVFFSRLDPLDFAQEGHRLEFAEAENSDSDLVYKGVVFNEMKGAMSSVTSTLWHTLCTYLYPSTTYHYNSGGDPAAIPELSYEQLRDFYKTHYHPSNAIFMTFGDIPAAEHQASFESEALQRFEPLDETIAVPDEKRYLAPIAVEESYAFDEEGSTANKTHIIISWLLGNATDLKACMQAHLLNSVLLDNSASPLLKALETSDLGTSPSPLCGMDDSQKEMCFVCGIEGSEPDKAVELENLVMGVLRDVADNGVPQEQVEASLHQLELQQREIGGDGYPYGLQLILTSLTSATHRGDPIALLDLEPVLAELRAAIADPDFIKSLARELLVDNPHRVRLTLRPEPALSARREKSEAAQLATIKAHLSDTEKQQIISQTAALNERQMQADDEGVLPKVGLEDISPEMAYVAATSHTAGALPLTQYEVGTNGLVYQQLLMSLPALTDAQIDLLPLYSSCLTELGVGDKDYLSTQLWQSQVCGAISAHASVRCAVDNLQSLSGHLVLSAKGLATNQAALCELMSETFESVRFDELPRLRELIAQMRARRESSVTGNGHTLAMAAAASNASPGAYLSHRWGGMEGIHLTKALDTRLDEQAELASFAAQLAELHALFLKAPRQALLVGEQEHMSDFQAAFLGQIKPAASAPFTVFSRPELCAPAQQLWATSTQVNFCARAYPTVPMGHADAAPLSVLGGFLRNGYLHRAIREQGGAYGGGAGQDNNGGSFRFFSYRDPRIEGTLDDFQASLVWLQEEKHQWQQVEEAILGVVSGIDKPSSPAGEAKQSFHAELYGRGREQRETFRNQVRDVKLDDLQRVAQRYLSDDKCSTAVITNADNAAKLDALKLTLFTL
ncbi:MAG: insulinase family protein [Gammaproteobacteria bacterium]|nr:insulinase family protein [Gammaproteobacteria bacterium]MBQ0839670.1 insulinase family protein [Gammaproteobacteria bacterium]